MSRLSYHTAGESHGPAVTALIEGFPADVPVDLDLINSELRRRQGGYGRGGRQKIELDSVQILGGVRHGLTLGSPIVLQIVNRDSRLDDAPPIHRPRPGHADFAGAMKHLTTDCRGTLERASAPRDGRSRGRRCPDTLPVTRIRYPLRSVRPVDRRR